MFYVEKDSYLKSMYNYKTFFVHFLSYPVLCGFLFDSFLLGFVFGSCLRCVIFFGGMFIEKCRVNFIPSSIVVSVEQSKDQFVFFYADHSCPDRRTVKVASRWVILSEDRKTLKFRFPMWLRFGCFSFAVKEVRENHFPG